MSNLVIVSGDYCSGSTLLFTLFRKTGHYYSLYEPLHSRLPEFLLYRARPDDYDHHFFVDDYYSEMRGFSRIFDLHDPGWGQRDLYLEPEAESDHLYRYLAFLIGTAFGLARRVMFKENRIAFRVGWMRARFPDAKFVHIYRDKEKQWKSNVRRVQAYFERDDVGQDSPSYDGFTIATTCEDLKGRFPELDAKNSKTGFERFSKLWDLSYAENKRYADISVDYDDLLRNFEATWERIGRSVGMPPTDTAALKQFVVPPEKQKEMTPSRSALVKRTVALVDRAGLRFARIRLRARRVLTSK